MELKFKNNRYLQQFIKNCEGLFHESDTILFKVVPKALYLSFTDPESFCIGELRFNLENQQVKLQEKFVAKILLDSLIVECKKAQHSKRPWSLIGRDHQLWVKMNKPPEEIPIKSCNHRRRCFHNLSSTHFLQRHPKEYLHFRLISPEFNRMMTRDAIINGCWGKPVELAILPQNSKQVKIVFTMTNQAGSQGVTTIHGSMDNDDVPILHIPTQDLRLSYLLIYMKRCQHIFYNPNAYVNLIVNQDGILLFTDISQDQRLLIFNRNMEGVDFESYV